MRKGIILFCLILIACSDESLSPDDRSVGYPFFPLEVGIFQEYEVEETTYQFEMPTTMNYQLRTIVVDSFQNQTGENTFIIHEFTRGTESDEWEFNQTNSARITQSQGVFIDGNIPELKLVFPIEAGKQWDGNALNSLEADEYLMDSLFAPFITTTEIVIPETLTVIQEDNQDLIVNFVSNHEIYGLGVGLVHKEEIDLSYCVEDDCIGQQIIDNGRVYRQTLIRYGKD